MSKTTKAYSLDLREKIIQFLLNGGFQRNAAKKFKISQTTVQRYWKMHQKGDLTPKVGANRKRKIDYEAVKDFVNKNPSKTSKEIGKIFNVSGTTILRILHSFDFSFKKKLFYTKKETKN